MSTWTPCCWSAASARSSRTALRGWFIAGAAGASLVWFSLLGFGARWLAPWFARPMAWQVLDGLIGATMFVLSALLVRHALIGM